MIVIGIDPDSKGHGVAVYDDKQLKSLHTLQLFDVMDMIGLHDKDNLLVSIENTLANNFVYSRNKNINRNIENKIALSVGRCQQSQEELMRGLDRIGVPYVLHKPQKGNWAKDKDMFTRITGWAKKSNEDTRSAAFFGYLEARR